MLKDCDWSLGRDYKTGSENEPLQFYLDVLANSNEFSLLLGYFSSSAVVEPSHVLKAMGLNDDDAFASLRFSFGKYNSIEEITNTIEEIKHHH